MLGAEGIKPGCCQALCFGLPQGEIKLSSLLVTANQPMIPSAYPLNILNGARIHSWNLSGFWCVIGGACVSASGASRYRWSRISGRARKITLLALSVHSPSAWWEYEYGDRYFVLGTVARRHTIGHLTGNK